MGVGQGRDEGRDKRLGGRGKRGGGVGRKGNHLHDNTIEFLEGLLSPVAVKVEVG